jgi:hypothetical protein
MVVADPLERPFDAADHAFEGIRFDGAVRICLLSMGTIGPIRYPLARLD